MKKIAIAVSVLLLVLAMVQAAPSTSQPAYTSYYTGEITAVGAKTLELHVLRGHSGIIHPVNVDEKTEVVLLNGQPGKLSDLKVGQWIRAYWNPDPTDPKQQRIVKIEPSMPSWAAQRLADLEKNAGALEVAVRVFINGKGDEEELHLLGPDNEGGYKEPFFARLTKDEMAKLLRYLAVEGFLADAANGAAGDGKLPLPTPPYVRLVVGKFYQSVPLTLDAVKRLEGIQAVLPDKAAAKMSGLLAKVREKMGVPTTTQPAAKAVVFDVHDGYFVSNKFEPKEPASFVVISDQKALDNTFGVAFVMGDMSHRLPANAFDSKMVVAAIRRGKATWDFTVQDAYAPKCP